MSPPSAAAVAAPVNAISFVASKSPALSEKSQAYLAPNSRQPLTQSELDGILGSAAEITPGRVGNLTPFQEAKLREMWLLACKAFGVYDGETLELVNSLALSMPSTPTPDAGSAAAAAAAPAKKSRGGFFSRKKKEEEPAPVADSASTSSGSILPDIDSLVLEDDKHGSNKAFKAAMSSYSGKELRTAFWNMVKADHPDSVLLRFLRARKWDVKAAFVMAVAALHWRLDEFKVESDIMLNGEAGAYDQSKSKNAAGAKEGADFIRQLEIGKNMLLGTDKLGRPVSIVRVKLHKIGEQSATSLERFTVFAIETSRLVLRPPIDTATVVFDMTDFGLANMDYAPVKFMIKCFEANYPESLGAVFIHKAPWIFSSIWNVIKGWLDPVVASKVHFTKDLDALAEHIPIENIHKSLGGKLDYDWKYIHPVDGENDLMKDKATADRLKEEQQTAVTSFEEATIEWVIKSMLLARGDSPDITQAAVDNAQSHRHRIARDLRESYWSLDPYIRARSFYDRINTLPTSTSANYTMPNPK